MPISIYGIHMHLAHYSKPHVQRHVVRVLWMVPLYGLNAWLALVLGLLCCGGAAVVPDAFRQCYEAYTVYSFYNFVVASVEDREGLPLSDVMAAQPQMVHLFPLRLAFYSWRQGCWVQLYSARPWAPGAEFLRRVECGIHNYVLVKPLVTVVALGCAAGGAYGGGGVDPGTAYPYLTFVDSAAQAWALYCLLQVYLCTHGVLPASTRPGLKFACVKGVVFATFWQGAALALAAQLGAFGRGSTATGWTTRCGGRANEPAAVADAVQDFLIACEMLLFALLHAAAFPSREYRDDHLPPASGGRRLRRLFDVRDVADDVGRHLGASAAAAGAGAAAALRAAARGAAAPLRRAVGLGGGGGGEGDASGALSPRSASAAADGRLLRAPLLLDDDFEEGDVADAPWLRLGGGEGGEGGAAPRPQQQGQQPPRLPLPPPGPGDGVPPSRRASGGGGGGGAEEG